jgi:hypothetical protein
MIINLNVLHSKIIHVTNDDKLWPETIYGSKRVKNNLKLRLSNEINVLDLN